MKVLVFLLAAGSALAASNTSIYQTKMAPLLKAQCAACHGASKPQGKFSIVSYAKALKGGATAPGFVPGNPDGSYLMQLIRGDKSPQMPPGKPMAKAEIDKLAAAIKEMKK